MYRNTLTDEADALLERLETVRTAFDASGILPRRWLGRLRRDLAVEAVAASTSMEGVPMTVDEVRRIVASLIMVRGGFRRPEVTSLEEWWGAHRDDDYDAFACLGSRWRAAADVTPFVLAHLRAQVAQVEALSLRTATQRAIWTALEDIVTEDVGASPRLANALFDAFFGRSVTNRYDRGLADVQAAAAASDLKRLESAGLLRSLGAGRSTTYVGTTRLAAAIAAAAGLPAPEPNAPQDAQRASVVAGLAGRLREGGAGGTADRPAGRDRR